MKTTIIILVIAFIFGCKKPINKDESNIELAKSMIKLSSVSYTVELKRFLIKKQSNLITFREIDSIRLISNEKCNIHLKQFENK